MYWQHLAETAAYKESMRATGTIDFNLTKLFFFFLYEMIVYVWSVAEFLSNRWRPSM